MKVLVYGAGAVGCYLGASLAAGDHDVTLIARMIAAEAIRKAGLNLAQPAGPDLRVQPETLTSVRQAFLEGRTYDLLLLAMKSYDVQEALDPLIAFCPQPFPPIITLQNGIGIEKMVRETLETQNVIAASLTTPVSRPTPDHVNVERAGRGLALAPTRPEQDVRQWVKLFQDAGIQSRLIDDHRRMKWSKALLNMLGNATSAIINRHPATVYEYGPIFDLEMEMLREALTVMREMKLKVVDLPGVPTTRLIMARRFLPQFLLRPILSRIVAGGRGDKLPSFHIDLTGGRRENEVLYHNGAVAAAGERLGVATPVNEALNDILLKMARGEMDWQTFDGSPQRLIAEVEKYRA